MPIKLFQYPLLLFALILGSCASRKEVVYLQDAQHGEQVALTAESLIRLQPQDKVSIIVKSRNATLADLYNLPARLHQIGQPSETGALQAQGMSLYTVDDQGNIDFPILGTIRAGGLTRQALAEEIKTKLVSTGQLIDAVVTVEYANLGVSIMGEVTRPGRYPIERDRLTILEALSLAGDLTIYGHRDRVLVIREEAGQRHTYRLDLRRAESLYSSPAYYVRQNDIIYIEPNSMRVGQSTVNGNNVLSTSFWISLASLGTSVALLIMRR